MGDCDVTPLLAIGRTQTLAGWWVIAAATAMLVVAALVTRRRIPGGVALLRVAMQHRALRLVALAGWLWLGWHVFVRTTR